MGDSGSWFRPGPAPAVASTWGMSWWMGACYSVSLRNSDFKINKTKLKNKTNTHKNS